MTNQGLLSSGLSRVTHNKRYIFWFWLLNLALAWFGTSAFRQNAHAILDRSLYSQRLMKGFDVGVFVDLLMKPDFGTTQSMTVPAICSAIIFFLATALFLPGIFAGFASTYRLPREEFFRACGRNLWRFIRIMIVAGIVILVVGGALFAASGAIVDKAGESTNERLPFELRMAGLAVIFLIMTTVRIWFDLAEVDTVLNDQRTVRKSIASAFRHTFRSLGRLLVSYVLVTIIAAILLIGGLWIWMKLVAPESVFGAFIIAQITLFLLLIPRFWQRGIAVSYWEQRMLLPLIPTQPVAITPLPVPPAEPAPVSSSPTLPPTELPQA
jgi:hypothetical protein